MLAHADDRIGEVLAALDRPGLAENTLIIFNSDNGPARSLKPTKLELQYDTATAAFAFVLAAKAALVHFDLALERRFILGVVIDDLPQPMKVKAAVVLFTPTNAAPEENGGQTHLDIDHRRAGG